MTKKIITLTNGETYTIEVTKEPEELHRPTRFEVEVESGISTGEMDAHGDNPTFAWGFPCNNIDNAVRKFVDKIEKLRIEYDYYQT